MNELQLILKTVSTALSTIPVDDSQKIIFVQIKKTGAGSTGKDERDLQ